MPVAVFDCALHPEVAAAAAKYRPFKIFLINLILSMGQSKVGMYINPRFKLPKMKSRGQIPLLSSWGVDMPDKFEEQRDQEKPKVEELDLESKDSEINMKVKENTSPHAFVKDKDFVVRYVGVPVEIVRISLKLPNHVGEKIKSSVTKVQTHFQDSKVLVEIPGCETLSVETNLTLKADGSKATCDLDKQHFVVSAAVASY